jgi:glutaredoxin
MIAVLLVLLAQADAGTPPAPPRVRSWKDAAQELHAPTAPVEEKLPRVLVYGAEWCGPCHKLQAWLREHEVEFGYVDIERNSVGLKRLKHLKHQQHLNNPGIPVIEIDGTLFSGFSPNKLEAALDEHKIAFEK